MALISCPECGKQISDVAESCPHCGFPVASRQAPPPEPDETADPNGKNVGCGTLMLWGIVFLIGGLILTALLNISPEYDSTKDPAWIIDEGKKSLKGVLRDPGSVEFREVWAGTLKGKDSSSLIACGYFNAKNGFGGRTGDQRFIASVGGMVMTEDRDSAMLNYTWEETCVTGRAR